MDTGYPALIADLPKQNETKPPTVPCAADSEVPQATITNSDPTGSPPTIKQASWHFAFVLQRQELLSLFE